MSLHRRRLRSGDRVGRDRRTTQRNRTTRPHRSISSFAPASIGARSRLVRGDDGVIHNVSLLSVILAGAFLVRERRRHDRASARRRDAGRDRDRQDLADGADRFRRRDLRHHRRGANLATAPVAGSLWLPMLGLLLSSSPPPRSASCWPRSQAPCRSSACSDARPLPPAGAGGGTTPVENMPGFIRTFMTAAPDTISGARPCGSFRGAGIDTICTQILALAVIGTAFFSPCRCGGSGYRCDSQLQISRPV